MKIPFLLKKVLVFYVIMKLLRIFLRYAASRFDLRIKLSALAYRISPALGGWIYTNYHELFFSPIIPALLAWLIISAASGLVTAALSE